MMNKIFGCKSITHLLYGVAILLPMMSILGRVCYTVVNKNAKDSYSFNQSVKLQKINSISSVIANETYTINEMNNGAASPIFYTNDANTILVDNFGFSGNYTYIGFRFDTRYENKYVYAYSEINTTIVESRYSDLNWINNSLPITFKLLQLSNDLYQGTNNYSIYLNVITNTNTLDNAFEYSLQTFVDDNNLGNVNLFSWFTDLFLDQSKPKNALYLNFVNWYLNYTLLVSSGYLLFMVMIWFTQYIRRIMDKSMYQDFGGF